MPETEQTKILTPEEEKLLRKHMKFYRALETGQRLPATGAQEHFVRVTRGQAVAETPHEIAYAKYMRIRAQQRPTQNTPIRDPAEGPTEGWFTRKDWKKLRGREYGDMRRRARGD